MRDIFTIGHYSHTEEEFLHLLKDAGVEVFVDVRAFPGSRKFPWFGEASMEEWLPEAGVGYVHIKELGGRRGTSPLVSPRVNEGWENQSFHNYADYTLSDCFGEGIDKLRELAKEKKVAYCCSELHPARCHRLLISNWLAVRGWNVQHIIPGKDGETRLVPHELGKWGAMPIVEPDLKVVYPRA